MSIERTIEHELCVGGSKDGKKVPVRGHQFMAAAPINHAMWGNEDYVTTERYHRAKIHNGKGTVHTYWCKEGEDAVDGLIKLASEDRWILSEDTMHTIMGAVNWCRKFDSYGPHDPEKLKNAMDELVSKYHQAMHEMRYR